MGMDKEDVVLGLLHLAPLVALLLFNCVKCSERDCGDSVTLAMAVSVSVSNALLGFGTINRFKLL